jgi:hypothetical protein
MAEFAYSEALDVLCGDASPDLGPLLAAACGTGGDPVLYLADFARQVLLPLTPGVPEEPVTGTLAGLVFTTGQPALTGAGSGPARALVPVREQTARIGVLAVTLPERVPLAVRQAEMLGVFVGLVVAGWPVSDALDCGGRAGASLPTLLQWDLLPPWAPVPGAPAGILGPPTTSGERSMRRATACWFMIVTG